MPTFLRFLMLLALVVWLGGIVFFGAVLAPTLFATLPKREMAGMVVTRSLGALHWIGIACGVVFLFASLVYSRLTSGSAAPLAWHHLLMVAMLALTLVSQYGVSPKMQALRRDMVEIDSIPPTDARRAQFNQLHRVSTGLEQVVLLMGLAVLWGVAKMPGPR
ncbi:MAG: DUF4149 domain-containing protein [Candidatus Koribacter versatilis]|uniref:DUF4149 domain-containing protein n=1 Tax=Candidatus Korobacter versatilis TaxID=658062 RepID=A0A932EQ45_9BACT|nr:DUF4149 domain-containing protein [Candidatus Koribacter versatilis]